MKPTIMILALALLVSGQAFAQAAPPEAINYQGVLRDSADDPLDGSVDMVFRFFDAATGGNELLVDSHLASGSGSVTVANGLFNVDVGGGTLLIGSGTGAVSTLRALFHDHTDVYMEVQVGSETLSPRTRVVASAYALNVPDETDVDAYVANNGYALQSSLAAVATSGNFADLSGVPAGIADGDDDTLGSLSCSDGQVAAWVGSAWTCVDVTPQVTNDLVYDSGWVTFPMRQDLTLSTGSSFEFALGIVRSWDDVGGEVVSPLMATNSTSYAPTYMQLDEAAGTVTTMGWDNLVAIRDPGDRSNVLVNNGNLRVTAFDRLPDWDSNWFSCNQYTTYQFFHSLGSVPQLVLLEVAQNSDGSGWRFPTLSASNHDGSSWTQTSIVFLDSTAVTIRTGAPLLRGRTNATGTAVAPMNGYCRVRAFVWTPDYDSGWLPITTTAGNRDKYVEHGLGRIPSMFMLYVAQNPDGSGWFVPAMGGYHSSYTYGVGVYDLTEDWVTIKGGASAVAQFLDSGGSGMVPAAGYVRFVAWK